MIGKLVKGVAKGIGEVIASPLTITNKTGKALNREFDKLTDKKS